MSVFSQTTTEKHGVDTSFIGLLNFPNDKKSIIECSFEMFRRNSYEVIGSRGKIEIPNAFASSGDAKLIIDSMNTEVVIRTFMPLNLYYEEFYQFSDFILKQMPLLIDMKNSAQNIRVISALKLSAKESRTIGFKGF